MPIRNKAEYAAYAMARNEFIADSFKEMAGMWLSYVVMEIKATRKFKDRTGNLRQSIGTDAIISASEQRMSIPPTDVDALTEVKIGVINILIPIGMEYAKDVEDRVHFAEPIVRTKGQADMVLLWKDFGVRLERFQNQFQ